ncbi:MAG: carboxypeptidase-like regulatory domain-containing protein [Myxococcota bacterium]
MALSIWAWTRAALVMAVAAGGLLACGNEPTLRVRVPDVEVVPAEPEPVLGSLKGRVCSPSGFSWVGAADVRVRGSDRVVQTDSAGSYAIDGLPLGEVTLDITKGSFSATVTVVVDGETAVDVGPSCLGGDVSIAVVVGHYDAIQNLLADLGLQYTLVEIEDTVDWLRDPGALSDYDIVFFNCGMRTDWVMYPEVANHLRDYVLQGGSIYASDRSYQVIEDVFPDAIDFLGDDGNPLDVARGQRGEYVARVVDRDLQAVLGTEVAHIHYDFDNWTIAERTRGGEALLEAEVLAAAPVPTDPPATQPSVLAVRARVGRGTVVFTSFHNQTQNGSLAGPPTGDMLRILEDIILSL